MENIIFNKEVLISSLVINGADKLSLKDFLIKNKNIPVGVGALTQNFVEGLVDKHLELEESTAQPVAKLPDNKTPLSLPSFENMLQQKREQQSSLISLKLPSQPTNSQLDAMQLMGIDMNETEADTESQ
ncbi:MAG: hypothetical protein QNJ54_27170 [Prochloraceae cyanobacterium]|nr:hypothetical protein [Prochloraceae cyanobacterium]